MHYYIHYMPTYLYYLLAEKRRQQQWQTATKLKHLAIQKRPYPTPSPISPIRTPPSIFGGNTKSEARLPHKRPTHKQQSVYINIFIVTVVNGKVWKPLKLTLK